MSIRIIHAADLHLDSPFEGLPADLARLRRAEQRRLPERIAALAAEKNAHLLLLAGDLLDGTYASEETCRVLAQTLSEVKIPVFIAPGNHDWFSRRSPYARMELPYNVHIFQTPGLRAVPLPELGVNIWGAGYNSNTCPPLLRGFRVPKQPGMKDILILHAEVGRGDSPYCPVTPEELAGSGFDYAALGHIHSFGGLRAAGNCRYAWPGCPEGRGFDECGVKGVLQVDLSDGGQCHAEFLPLGGREYRKLTVEAGEDAFSAVLHALSEDARRHIYRITLAGECAAAPDLPVLAKQLEDRCFALTLLDETRPARDLWDRTAEDTLTGAFLRRMRSRLNAAEDPEERALLLEAVRLGMAALEGREAAP